jgi:hypothetical protein
MRLETITPAMAQLYLDTFNIGPNRAISDGNVEKYGQAMAAGRWRVNGDAIRFSITNKLLDGQHRLLACALYDAPFTTYVVRDLPDEVMPTIDAGQTRTGGQVLKIAGVQNGNVVAAMANAIYRYDHNQNMSFPVDNQQRLETLDRYPDLVEHTGTQDHIRHNFRRIPNSLVAGLHYLFTQADEKKAERFLKALTEGAEYYDGNPASSLRRLMLNASMAKGRIAAQYWNGYTIKAWNSYFVDQRLHLMKIGDKETLYPTIAGRPRQPWSIIAAPEGPGRRPRKLVTKTA